MSSNRTFALPPEPFTATATPPGDKSLGHRALILAAIAAGSSVVANTSTGADIASTRRVTQLLGVTHEGDRVISPGVGSWLNPSEPLDCGNSGTTMRLLTGALASSRIGAELVGDASLMLRPMSRLVAPLKALGARIAVGEGGTAPIRVDGSPLKGADISLPVPSAQVRTAVALAALGADGPTRIDSPPGFRDHTERWLSHLGLGRRESPTAFLVMPGQVPPLEVTVPGDPSSAAFLWSAAAIVPGSRITTPHVSLNEGRTGFLEILSAMGAEVTVEHTAATMDDPVGTVVVEGRELSGIELSGELVVRALDEIPLVAVLAAAAEGPTAVTGAEELRVKESDRIASSVALARAAGAEAHGEPDGLVVHPSREMRLPSGVDARGDHRVAMAGAVASLVRGAAVEVAGFRSADISWPGFADVLEGLWS